MATKKSSTGKKKVHKVMSEYGDLKSGSGGKVKSRKQAVAIALSEARSAGAKIPKKKKSEVYTRPSALGSYPGKTVFNDGLPRWRETSSPRTSRKSVVSARSRPS